MLAVAARLTAINRRTTLVLSLICLIMAMLFVSADAISRKFGFTVPGAVSITELFISGLVFGGIVYAQTNRTHLHVGLLDAVLSRRGRMMTDLFGLAVGFLATATIAWFGFLQAIDSWLDNEIAESSIDVPLWPSRLVLAAGSALLCLQFVLDAAGLILTRSGQETRTLDSAT